MAKRTTTTTRDLGLGSTALVCENHVQNPAAPEVPFAMEEAWRRVAASRNFDAAAVLAKHILRTRPVLRSAQGRLEEEKATPSGMLRGLAWGLEGAVTEAFEAEVWQQIDRMSDGSPETMKNAIEITIEELVREIERGPEDNSTGRSHNFVGRQRWEAARSMLRDLRDLHKGL